MSRINIQLTSQIMDHLSEIREMALNFFQYVYESLKKEDNCK